MSTFSPTPMGDGVGDVNERIAGTSVEDAADTPGPSTVDVLVLFDRQMFDAYDGDPYTRLHHLMTVTRAIFTDSGTNIRLRVVGMSPVGETDRGISVDMRALMESHGADLMLQVHLSRFSQWHCGFDTLGCAMVGGREIRGLWTPAWAATLNVAGAWTPAHELGHALGLAHSARQGEKLRRLPLVPGALHRRGFGPAPSAGHGHVLRRPFQSGRSFLEFAHALPRPALRRARGRTRRRRRHRQPGPRALSGGRQPRIDSRHRRRRHRRCGGRRTRRSERMV